ncbi:Hypothetical_protein [Hexamita inflata]|uniref:Hypothetical_protein n=1 Tax=Hexamita inflata TaxID=28002 RepID=A0AA86NEE8_9EUKA|nr:Hypothetical protein HINF_LOCUS5273 [Hexamita inflata]CAI9918653.1 Hypothetical protein HINF_LOCUS6298 [Hexamita inflata]
MKIIFYKNSKYSFNLQYEKLKNPTLKQKNILMLFHSFEVATLSKLRYNFFINVESWTETTSFCSDKHLQKEQFFIHLGLFIFQRQNYIDLYSLVYNLQAFYWLKQNSII